MDNLPVPDTSRLFGTPNPHTSRLFGTADSDTSSFFGTPNQNTSHLFDTLAPSASSFCLQSKEEDNSVEINGDNVQTAQIITSSRNKPMAILNGYVFNISNKRKPGVHFYWQCEMRRKRQCSAKLLTTSNEVGTDTVVVEHRFEHNHPPNAFAVAKRQIKTNARMIAAQCPELGPSAAVQHAIQGMPESVVSELKLDHLKRNVSRQRLVNKNKNPLPPNSKQINFEIPETFLRYEDGSSFVLYDSWTDPQFLLSGFESGENRVLILGRQDAIFNLQSSTEWAIDTYLPKRPRFFQFYWSVYTPLGTHFRPQLFMLATQKTRLMYDFVIGKIQTLIGAVNLTTLYLEHNRDVMDTFSETFGDQLQFHGCFLSMWQDFYDQIVRLDLNTHYGNDLEFAMIARYLPCLAFLPDYKIHEGFSVIANYARSKFDALMDPLLTWFQTRYVGVMGHFGGPMQCNLDMPDVCYFEYLHPQTSLSISNLITNIFIQPEVSIPFWNLNQRMSDNLQRLSTSLESFRGASQRAIKSDDSVWHTLSGLHEVSSATMWVDPSVPVSSGSGAAIQRLVNLVADKQRQLAIGELALLGFFREVSTKLDVFM